MSPPDGAGACLADPGTAPGPVPAGAILPDDMQAGEVHAGDVQAGDVQAWDVPDGDLSSGVVPAGGRPVEHMSVEEVPADAMPPGDMLLGPVPDGGLPGEEMLAWDMLAGDAEAEAMPPGNVPSGIVSDGDARDAGLPGDDVFAWDRPAGDVQAGAGAAWSPPMLSPVAVRRANVLLGCAPLVVQIDGMELWLEFAAAGPAPDEPTVCVEWAIGGHGAWLVVPARIIAAVVGLLQPEGAGGIRAALLPLLIELALQPLIEMSERAVVQRISVEAAAPAGAAPPASWSSVGVRVGMGGQVGTGLLWTAPDALASLADLAMRGQRRPMPRDLPVPVAIRLGVSRLDLPTLRSLRIGDTVIVRQTLLTRNRLALVAGERLAAVVRRRAAGRATVVTGFRPTEGTAMQDWTMPMGEGDTPLRDEAVGAVEVTLVFELGRRPMTLDALGGLVPGTVFDLGAGLLTAVDVLTSGRRIAQGEVVRVGDAIGVRITRLSANG